MFIRTFLSCSMVKHLMHRGLIKSHIHEIHKELVTLWRCHMWNDNGNSYHVAFSRGFYFNVKKTAHRSCMFNFLFSQIRTQSIPALTGKVLTFKNCWGTLALIFIQHCIPHSQALFPKHDLHFSLLHTKELNSERWFPQLNVDVVDKYF